MPGSTDCNINIVLICLQRESNVVLQATENTLSAKLKRQKLGEMYPNIDGTVLDDIFQANECSLEDSIHTIQGSTGDQPQPTQTVYKDRVSDADYDDMLVKQILQESMNNQVRNCNTDSIEANVCLTEIVHLLLIKNENVMINNGELQWLGVCTEPDSEYQAMDDPDYHDYRAEASMHYRLRQELFQKAQEAYRHGMRNVASFYSQQGHLHTEKLRDANSRAAEHIMASRSVFYICIVCSCQSKSNIYVYFLLCLVHQY